MRQLNQARVREVFIKGGARLCLIFEENVSEQPKYENTTREQFGEQDAGAQEQDYLKAC